MVISAPPHPACILNMSAKCYRPHRVRLAWQTILARRKMRSLWLQWHVASLRRALAVQKRAADRLVLSNNSSLQSLLSEVREARDACVVQHQRNLSQLGEARASSLTHQQQNTALQVRASTCPRLITQRRPRVMYTL